MSHVAQSKLPLEEFKENGKPKWCLGCPLYNAPGPVFGPPPEKNDTLFLGEAPGKDEVLVGKNFVGGSGRVLYRWAQQVGIHRDSCEVRNVVKCRPTKLNNEGREVDRPPTEDEMRHCLPFLSKELEVIDPNLIVALGATALYVTTGRSAISTYRGRVIEGPVRKGKVEGEEDRRIKVLPIYHPAFIMRAQELWPLAVFDLSKTKTQAKFPEIRRAEVSYNTSGGLRCSPEEFKAACRRSGYLIFDFEAEGIIKRKGWGLDLSTGAITVIGVASGPYTADALHNTPENQQLFRELLGDPNITKVTQNGETFDIPYAERRGFEFRGRSFDTLQAIHLTNSEFEKNLEFIASLYTDMDNWKGKEMYKSGFEALKLGNCKDVDVTARAALGSNIAEGLIAELKSLDMEDLYWNGVMPVQPVLRAMSDRGMKQDTFKAFTFSKQAKLFAAQLGTKIGNVIGQDTNLDSPQQLGKLLYDVMGLPEQKIKTKGEWKRSCNDDSLDNLEVIVATREDLKHCRNVFNLINKRRKVKKLDSTYLETETDENNFVHYKVGSAKAALEKGEKGSGARNGRLISWNPNFQNQPLEARELYIPDDEESVFIEADWSQIEWRTAMVLSGEPYGLELLASGADNHTVTAAECFGITTDEVLRKDAEFSGGHGSPRFETKFIVYGLGYGRGNADIAKQLGRSIPWVEGFVNRFRTRLPVYWAWRGNLEGFVSKNSYLRNPFGRRRWWYTRQVTEMYNFPPSSTAADMMYRILPMLEEQLPHGATLRLTVHDSVLVNSPKDVARRAAECLRDVMHTKWPGIVEYSDRPEVVKKHYPDGWFCPADLHVGLDWKQCKKGNKTLEKELGIK